MWKFVILCLSLWEYSYAGPLGIKKNMPIVQDNDGRSESTLTDVVAEEERPASDLIVSKLNLPSNATSIRADITDGFSCDNKTYGYYADVDNECQIFHVCLPVVYADGKENTFRWSFICPEETIFSQDSFTCMRAEDMNIDCDESYMYYELNRNFGVVEEESIEPAMNSENDEEIRMENKSKQPEITSEIKLDPIKETPAKVQVNPNRKKNSSQRRKPTQPTRKTLTTAYTFEEAVNEADIPSTTQKLVSPTFPKITRKPPITMISNVQTQKKDQRPDAYGPKRKRPQVQQVQQTLRDVTEARPILENSQSVEALPLYPVQMQPEPQPTLKIETFFKPQAAPYHSPSSANNQYNESEKSTDLGDEEDEKIHSNHQHGHLAQASEIKEISIRPSNQSEDKIETEEMNPLIEGIKTALETGAKKEATSAEDSEKKETHKISMPPSTETKFPNPEMAISENNVNGVKFAAIESEAKEDGRTEIITTLNRETEPLAEESFNHFVTIKPESIKLPEEVPTPLGVGDSSNSPEGIEKLQESGINEEKSSVPTISDDMTLVQELDSTTPAMIDSQNVEYNPANQEPESLQNESYSAQNLIANFLSTLVNAESSKLEEKPAVTYEDPMGDSLAQTEEIKIETLPDLPVSIPINHEKLTDSDIFQIPVHVIHSPVEEGRPPQMEPHSSSIDEKQVTPTASIDENKTHSDVFLPLSVDDVVELVKDRLNPNPSAANENDIGSSDLTEPQSSEILPIYHRISEVSSNPLKADPSPINEPTLVAVISQDASNQQTETKPGEGELAKLQSVISDKKNGGGSSTPDKVVLRRNVKIHKVKMDPRKRRFLFRSHSS